MALSLSTIQNDTISGRNGQNEMNGLVWKECYHLLEDDNGGHNAPAKRKVAIMSFVPSWLGLQLFCK